MMEDSMKIKVPYDGLWYKMGGEYLKTITKDDLKSRSDIQIFYNSSPLYHPSSGMQKKAGDPFTIYIPYLWQHGVDVCRRPPKEFPFWGLWTAPRGHIITEEDLVPFSAKKNIGLWYFIKCRGWYGSASSVPKNASVDLVFDGHDIGTFENGVYTPYTFSLEILRKKLSDSYAGGLPKESDFVNDPSK